MANTFAPNELTPGASALPSWITQRATDGDGEQPQRPGADAGASFLTISDVASRLRVSTRTVRRLIARDQMRCVRVGRAVRIPREVVEGWGRHGDVHE